VATLRTARGRRPRCRQLRKSYEYEVLAFDSLEAAQFHVLGFGAGVEAVAPPALRAAVRQEAAAVLRRYGTGEA